MRWRSSLGLVLVVVIALMLFASLVGPRLYSRSNFSRSNQNIRSLQADSVPMLPAMPAAEMESEQSRAIAATPGVAASPAAGTNIMQQSNFKAVAGKPLQMPSAQNQLVSAATSYTDGKHQFVRTASAQFDVKDVYVSALAIEDAVASNGGFVVHNSIASEVLRTERFGDGEGKLTEITAFRVHGNLTVRVPSDKTQGLLRAIVGQIEFLGQRNFNARDVQFDLLRRQLAYVREQEAQQELGQAVASGGKLADKTEALGARGAARASRDEARVNQKELEDQIAFSTIELSLVQPEQMRQSELVDADLVFRQHRPATAERVLNALSSGFDGLRDFAIAIIAGWPLWLAVLATALGATYVVRRRRNR